MDSVYILYVVLKKQKNSHTQQNTNTEIEALHCGSRGGPGFNLGRESRISWGGEVSTGGAPAIWGVAVFKKIIKRCSRLEFTYFCSSGQRDAS